MVKSVIENGRISHHKWSNQSAARSPVPSAPNIMISYASHAPPAARWQIRRRRRGTCDEASMSPRAAAGPSGLRITTAGVTSPNLANASRRRMRFRRPSSVNTPVLEHRPARVRVIAGALSVIQALSRASVSSTSGVTCHKFASARKPFFAGSWNHRRKKRSNARRAWTRRPSLLYGPTRSRRSCPAPLQPAMCVRMLFLILTVDIPNSNTRPISPR